MRLFILGLAAFLFAAPASAQTINAADPEELVRILQFNGYRAELTTDREGDPLIKTGSVGANWEVYFYGCTNGTRCTSIQFAAGFNYENGYNGRSINEWNRDMRYGKVYLDRDGDPFIEMDINLENGVNQRNFESSLKVWDEVLGDFLKHIEWN